MAVIIFYEKPGCATNARQKRALEAAGHTIMVKNLLTEPWTAESLRGFFRGTPPATWFNAAAPRVKSGEIDPDGMDSIAALTLMLAEPLLIRRPLVDVSGQKSAGFDNELVASLLGNGNKKADIQGCERHAASAPCPNPDSARAES